MSHYPPTDQRREELREQGIFPRSRDLDLFGLFSGFLLGLFFLKRISLFEEFSLPTLLFYLLVIPCCTALGVLVSSLVQSRFLVRFRTGGARSRSRLTPFETVFSAVKGVLWLGILYLLLKHLLNSDFPLAGIDERVFEILGLALLRLFVLGIVGRFAVGLLFAQAYAMSKEEILAEAQDSEVRPEFRRARSQ